MEKLAFSMFVLSIVAIMVFWIGGILLGGHTGHQWSVAAFACILPAVLFGIMSGLFED